MSAAVQEILAQDRAGDRHLRDLITRRGGSYIAQDHNQQPLGSMQISSLHFGGIVGIGPGLFGAAKDWRRQARAQIEAQIEAHR
ncbi:hypothetical protein [Yoonia sp.]|uniref:hypothetical protein n=1 Tax=Yoonia sp. TaxID=2212373 RepID=UPI0025F45738|nr:hypothetical protein [Yoonia sp.]